MQSEGYTELCAIVYSLVKPELFLDKKVTKEKQTRPTCAMVSHSKDLVLTHLSAGTRAPPLSGVQPGKWTLPSPVPRLTSRTGKAGDRMWGLGTTQGGRAGGSSSCSQEPQGHGLGGSSVWQRQNPDTKRCKNRSRGLSFKAFALSALSTYDPTAPRKAGSSFETSFIIRTLVNIVHFHRI